MLYQNSQVCSFYDVSPNVALLEGNLDGRLRILLFPSELLLKASVSDEGFCQLPVFLSTLPDWPLRSISGLAEIVTKP